MKEPARYHQERAEEADRHVGRLKKVLHMTVLARVLLFGLIVLNLYLTWGSAPWIPILSTIFFISLFLGLVRFHSLRSDAKAFWERKAALHRSDRARLEGEMPKGEGFDAPEPEHAFADDLDIFAEKGLFNWLDRSFSIGGQRKLIHRLAYPSDDPEEIEKLQAAVGELSEKADERAFWRAHGRKLSQLEPDRGSVSQLPKGLPLFLRILVPAIMTALLIGTLIGPIPFQGFALSLILPLTLIGTYGSRVRDGFRRMEADRERVRGVREVLQRVEALELRSELLQAKRERLFAKNGVRASEALKKLDRILEAYESRSNPFVGIGLNLLFLWDLQCYERLRLWAEQYGSERESWVNVVLELDSLSSLASVAADHPSFHFPEPQKEGGVLEGKGLGHPLIPADECVDNDLEIPSTGHIKIVTGANMAGKSTFLRTVGVNWILAKAGTAVRAERMRFRPLALFSSMRTSDDLAEHESFFYAELKRLRMIVDELEAGKEVLILLDEILQGTNSEDKKRGSRRFLERILKYPVAGLIATHDLDLTQMEESHPEQIENLCFEAELIDGRSHFDHKLRKGVCRNMNASALMESMGIG